MYMDCDCIIYHGSYPFDLVSVDVNAATLLWIFSICLDLASNGLSSTKNSKSKHRTSRFINCVTSGFCTSHRCWTAMSLKQQSIAVFVRYQNKQNWAKLKIQYSDFIGYRCILANYKISIKWFKIKIGH